MCLRRLILVDSVRPNHSLEQTRDSAGFAQALCIIGVESELLSATVRAPSSFIFVVSTLLLL